MRRLVALPAWSLLVVVHAEDDAMASGDTDARFTQGVSASGPRERCTSVCLLLLWGLLGLALIPPAVHAGEPTNLTRNGARNWHPSWSPDGLRFAYTSGQDIHVMNADGSGQSSLTQNEGWNGDPAWSADGAQIAYVSVTSLRGGTSDVYVMEADGRRKTNLTQDQTSNWAPSWSRDGTKIAYEAAPVRYNEVFVMDPDGNNQTNLTRHDASDRVPSWSPDGLLIAFASNRDREPGTYDIYTMASDGSNVQRLTHGLLWDVTSGISWSPDGSRIAYASWTVPGTGTAISVMGSDGENHVRLTQARFATNTPGRHFDYWSPQWSPDGTRRDMVGSCVWGG